MPRGSGVIIRTNAAPPPGGGGVTAANNGLSLSGSTVQLGGSPLLGNILIPLATFDFQLQDAASGVSLLLQPSFQAASLSAGAPAGSQILLDGLNGFAQVETNSGSSFLRLDENVNNRFHVELLGNNVFDLDRINGTYRIGDLSNTANWSELAIDDLNNVMQFSTNLGIGGQTFLRLDAFSGRYLFGDTGSSMNGTMFDIDDFNQTAVIQDSGSVRNYLLIDILNGMYKIGDIDSGLNGLRMEIDDANLKVEFKTLTLDLLWLDATSRKVLMGDISAGFNGTTLEVDDINSNIALYNVTNTATLTINGVAGFTGTVTPVTSITVNNGIVTNVT